DGRELTAAISEILAELNNAEKNGWGWTPPPKPLRCTTPPRGMGTINYEFDDYHPPECFTVPKNPGELVDRLNHKQKKWREFILRDAYTETANWQDFVLQFTNTYTAAYKTYGNFISQIANQKFLVEKKVANARPDFLYWRPMLLGFDLKIEGEWDGQICHLPKATKDLLAEGRAIVDAEIAHAPTSLKNRFLPDTFLLLPNWVGFKSGGFNTSLHFNETEAMKRNMKTIRDGLVALDCRVPMSVAPEYKSVRDVNPQQLESLRLKRFTMAVATLFTILTREPTQGHARWTDAGRDLDHPMYPWFAKINPYMRLNMLLGDPEPYPEGVTSVRKLNDEESMRWSLRFLETHP
ncbi:MAG: hypothetical protein AAB250_07395, partial [Bdellovibrionota bacterium]